MTRIFLTAFLLGGLTYTTSAQHKGCSTKEGGDNKINVDFHNNASDSTKSRGLADNYFLWDEGSTIKVKFLSGSPELQKEIFAIAKQWEQHANIKFALVQWGDADIRVKIGNGNGHNSFIGTVSKQIEKQYETMNLDSADIAGDPRFLKNVTLHEFGHAIGLLHEHSSPISGINWDKQKLYKEYAKMGWTEEDVDYQVFRTYNTSYTNGTKYDNKSIMHYPIMPGETTDGYTIGWNFDLSQGDKDLIKALYPFKGKRKNEVTRINIVNYGGIEIMANEKKKGISLFPSLNLKTGGKGGPVKMIFKFYDEEGYGIRDENGKYQENGTVATLRTVTLPANKAVKYNQNGKKDFEFFIPLSEIPASALSENMTIVFKIVYLTNEGEQKNLYISEQLNFKYPTK